MYVNTVEWVTTIAYKYLSKRMALKDDLSYKIVNSILHGALRNSTDCTLLRHMLAG